VEAPAYHGTSSAVNFQSTSLVEWTGTCGLHSRIVSKPRHFSTTVFGTCYHGRTSGSSPTSNKTLAVLQYSAKTLVSWYVFFAPPENCGVNHWPRPLVMLVMLVNPALSPSSTTFARHARLEGRGGTPIRFAFPAVCLSVFLLRHTPFPSIQRHPWDPFFFFLLQSFIFSLLTGHDSCNV
jgi:hypothetical protein